MANRWGKVETDILFSWAPKSLWMVAAAMKLKDACSLEEKAMTNLDTILKSWDITLLTKVHIVKVMAFSSSHVRIWELDHKEGWALKNWCFLTVVLEKTPESPLDSKEIQPVNPKGNQPWILFGRNDAKAEAPIFWPPDSWLLGKDPDAGKDWRQKEKRAETVGWHPQFNGHELGPTPGDSEG